MKSKFEKLLKNIFLTSVTSIIATHTTKAAAYNLPDLDANTNNSEISEKNDFSQKFILKFTGDNSYLIAGHRSHRSHSSHRSHTSHRSSSSVGSYTGSSSSSTTYYNVTTTSTNYSLGDRLIKPGMKGKDVKELTTLLIEKGYFDEKDLVKDASELVIYSGKLIEAVKKFQRTTHQNADGIVGKNTISSLKTHLVENKVSNEKINLGDRVLKKGMIGTDVTQLKNILIDKGFLAGPLVKGNSMFDEILKNAVIKFQNSINIDADGIVEAQTVYFLKK